MMQTERSISEINIGAEICLKKPGNFGILGKVNGLSKFLGPAFIVSVAYIDPGN